MWLLKLIRKTVGIHQSARQFGFPSSAGYMLIIVLVGLFPIHIWNLQHSRELIKLEEKYIKKKNQWHFKFNFFFKFSSQSQANHDLTNSPQQNSCIRQRFWALRGRAAMTPLEQILWEGKANLPCSSTAAVHSILRCPRQLYPFPLGQCL